MSGGPVPMEVGEVEEKWGQEDWYCELQADFVQAVGPDTQCRRCGGWGRRQRECLRRPGKATAIGRDSEARACGTPAPPEDKAMRLRVGRPTRWGHTWHECPKYSSAMAVEKQ